MDQLEGRQSQRRVSQTNRHPDIQFRLDGVVGSPLSLYFIVSNHQMPVSDMLDPRQAMTHPPVKEEGFVPSPNSLTSIRCIAGKYRSCTRRYVDGRHAGRTEWGLIRVWDDTGLGWNQEEWAAIGIINLGTITSSCHVKVGGDRWYA